MYEQAKSLPKTAPFEDITALWSLQTELLQWAEILMGKRDKTKEICQPIFRVDGPIIINTPSLDGAFAGLSEGSKFSWHTAVYELAHETVHLLNPVVGMVTWLEEGVAVEFSILAQQRFGLKPLKPRLHGYIEARRRVQRLPGGVMAAAKRVRETVGSLNTVEIHDMLQIFPKSSESLLRQLCGKCKLR